ncbi:MAG: hypothetical protein IT207_09135, partial [Fimbriimonadaceae bacterium]|nr:hypothetical protein [Fimbriimonadaceae bacterium]
MIPAERLCVEAAADGPIADLTTLPAPDRALTADFVRRLVSGAARGAGGRPVAPLPAGVRVRGLVVAEDLDLSNLDAPYPVELTDGEFRGRVSLEDAGLRSLRLDGSTFSAPVDARNLETRAGFTADRARFLDWLSLAGAEIGGDLSLVGATLASQTPVERLAPLDAEYAKGVALDADGIEVGGSVFLQAVDGGPRFEAVGAVRLL